MSGFSSHFYGEIVVLSYVGTFISLFFVGVTRISRYYAIYINIYIFHDVPHHHCLVVASEAKKENFLTIRLHPPYWWK